MTPKQFQKIIEREVEAILDKEIPDGDEYHDVREAHRRLYMLSQGLKSKESVEAVLRWVVVGMAESKAWADCKPNLTRWPDGFASHNDFIQEAITLAGWGSDRKARNLKSRLIKLANLALFAVDHGITIDEALNENWTQLRDGLPAIGRAMAINDEDDAVEALEEILDDVQELSPKDFKDKYITPRHEKASTGTIKTTKHGVTVAVFVLNSADDIERFSQHVGAISEWGLDADVFDNGTGAAVNIRGAQQVSSVYREPEKEAA